MAEGSGGGAARAETDDRHCTQVTDIVDAMVLKRLMECLMHYGVVCVMTSKSVLQPAREGAATD